MNDESGVSEAIGFMLLFMITVMGIGLVTLYGYPMLLDQQISTDDRNMEQLMINIQGDVKLLTHSNVPYRDVSMNIAGGSLWVHDFSDTPQTFQIDYWDGGSIGPFMPGEVQYTSDGGNTVITVENGAIVKREQNGEGSTMLAEPRWFYDGNTGTFVIFLTRFKADNTYSLGGIGNLPMSMCEAPDVVDDPNGAGRSVTITYTKDSADDYSKAWENYFTGSSIVDGGLTKTGGSYVLSSVDRLVVKTYNISIGRM
ncbi:MAG: hypothetical protein U9N40_01060 [Euryarchaeota archaeon]|nr:hypothetical protein [Euryarchaeota archaeon]